MASVDIALEERDPARTVLRVSGRLRPGWCGNLSTGLADAGVDIARARAVSTGAGVWEALFELQCAAGKHLGPSEVEDWLDRSSGAGFAARVELAGFRLARSPAHGGSLRLEVEAADHVGFLAALLRRLAYFSLFPVELRLDTLDGAVRDHFWLRGAGSSEPRPSTEAALAASLQALVRPLG